VFSIGCVGVTGEIFHHLRRLLTGGGSDSFWFADYPGVMAGASNQNADSGHVYNKAFTWQAGRLGVHGLRQGAGSPPSPFIAQNDSQVTAIMPMADSRCHRQPSGEAVSCFFALSFQRPINLLSTLRVIWSTAGWRQLTSPGWNHGYPHCVRMAGPLLAPSAVTSPVK
jgi:hypothetical protein